MYTFKVYPHRLKAIKKAMSLSFSLGVGIPIQINVVLASEIYFAFAPMGPEAINSFGLNLCSLIFRFRFRSVWVDP